MRSVPAVVVCLLVVTAGCLVVEVGNPDEPAATATGSVPGVNGPAWSVTVVEVVDGDTIEIRYDNGSTDTVRLLGVDTPEVHVETSPGEFEGVPDSHAGREWLSDWGDDASAFLRDRIAGETVVVQADAAADRRGSYGRLLAYVYHDGTDVNELLLERGFARLYESEFAFRDEYRTAEDAAMADDVGVWGYRDGGTARLRQDRPVHARFLRS